MNDTITAVETIRNRLDRKQLSVGDVFNVMDQISFTRSQNLSNQHFRHHAHDSGFSDGEISYLINTLVESPDPLKFQGVVAGAIFVDEGLWESTAIIVAAIVAAAGFKMPVITAGENTSAGGVIDIMNILGKINFSRDEIIHLVNKTGTCIVCDTDKNGEYSHGTDSDKLLVATVAHCVGFGINHFVIDLPYGSFSRFQDLNEAESFKRKITHFTKQFNIVSHVYIHKEEYFAKQGIGPLLYARDVLRVLEQQDDKSQAVENYSVHIADKLLDLCLVGPHSDGSLKTRIMHEFGSTLHWAQYILHSGHALKKMLQVIQEQGGDENVKSTDLKPAKLFFAVQAAQDTTIKKINNKNCILISKILGAPRAKSGGIYIHCGSGEQVSAGQILFTLYSEHEYNLKEAIDSLGNFPLYY